MNLKKQKMFNIWKKLTTQKRSSAVVYAGSVSTQEGKAEGLTVQGQPGQCDKRLFHISLDGRKI